MNKAKQIVDTAGTLKELNRDWTTHKCGKRIRAGATCYRCAEGCPLCKGSGTYYEPQGEDDVVAEVCDCQI